MRPLLLLLLLLFCFGPALGQGKRGWLRRVKYAVEKDSCGPGSAPSTRRFAVGPRQYQVRYEVFCTGQYSVLDTVPERATIFQYPEQNVRIRIVAGSTKEVIISKASFHQHFAAEREWHKLNLGATTIDRIDEAKHWVLFSTLVRYPYSDRGWLLRYAVDFNGGVKYLGVKPAEQL